MMADLTPYESDKQNIIPINYEQTAVYSNQNHTVSDQTVIHVANPVPCPKDYLAFSIFVTICCCLPFGVVALVKSSEVRTRSQMGDLQGAEISSSQARMWSFTAFFCGIFLVVAFFVTVMILALI